ncbi:hypothetical protein IWW34DRAFT_632030 [Fusarium oxysporum f. sp. albedinis]|nr:hypothetical protein IWW34DRAFT_632030 [Fusarium oxysporum f. sp. albedinis]
MDARINNSNEVNEAEANVAPLAPFSCLLCRKSKLKCDRTRPSCSRCSKQSYDCVYSLSRQPYQSKSRGQAKELEARLGCLERLLQSSQETRASFTDGSQYRCNSIATVGNTPTSQDEDALVRLGLYEETPPRELIETLYHALAYTTTRRSALVTPLLHRQRFMAPLFLPDHMKPPMCLQYIVMASAAETSDAYRHLGMIFYKRAIKYLQSDDLGKLKNDVAHGGPYSAMIGLLVPRLDGRRLYMTRITRLPTSEEAYTNGQEEHTRFLGDQLLESEPHSTFAGAVLAAHIFHRTIEHTGTNNSQDQESQDFKGDLYWQRHKSIDNDLKFMLLMLPKNLCLPANYRTHNAIFVNVMLQTATICLHRAALWRMKSNLQGLPSYLIRLSQDRLLPAAEEILTIFRMIPDLVFMASTSPTDPDGEHGQNLDFILKILVAFGNTNLVANALANEIVKEMKQCGQLTRDATRYSITRYAASIFLSTEFMLLRVLVNRYPGYHILKIIG